MASEGLPADVSPPKRRKLRRVLLIAMLSASVLLAAAVWFEVNGSYLQSYVFSGAAHGSHWDVQPSAAPNLRLPLAGPYDERLGYSRMEAWLPRLNAAGYGIAAQARQSEGFRDIVDRGYYAIYREKSQAGLSVLDRNGKPLYARRFPQRQYASFEAIPPVLVAALLYVENRDLLDAEYPMRNPAVELGAVRACRPGTGDAGARRRTRAAPAAARSPRRSRSSAIHPAAARAMPATS